MLGDGLFPVFWRLRVELADPPSELRHIAQIQLVTAGHLTNSSTLAGVGIGQALGFGPGDRRFLDQQALPLVALAHPTPFQDHRRQVPILGLADLIRVKRALSRDRDLPALRLLEALAQRRQRQ